VPKLIAPHQIRVSSVEQLLDFVDGLDVGDVADLVLVLGEVDVELEVVVVAEHLEGEVVEELLDDDLLDHEAVDELVDFLDGDVHAVVGGDVALELEEHAADVVDVDEGELLVDVVLDDVDEEVVVAVVFEAGELRCGA